MATSVVSICNRALAKLGAIPFAPLASIDDDSTEAMLCRQFYEPCRDELLRAHPWNFAETRGLLGAVLTDEPDDEVYEYLYQIPSDCLFFRGFNAGDSYNRTGNKIYCNVAADDAYCRYTRRITDPAEFDASFAEALVYRLATDLAVPLTNDFAKEQAMRERFILALSVAQRVDADEYEGTEDFYTNDSWTASRS